MWFWADGDASALFYCKKIRLRFRSLTTLFEGSSFMRHKNAYFPLLFGYTFVTVIKPCVCKWLKYAILNGENGI